MIYPFIKSISVILNYLLMEEKCAILVAGTGGMDKGSHQDLGGSETKNDMARWCLGMQ